jgi:hypothetical protein
MKTDFTCAEIIDDSETEEECVPTKKANPTNIENSINKEKPKKTRLKIPQTLFTIAYCLLPCHKDDFQC